MTNFEYDDALIAWEGRCCNGMKIYNRDRGSTIMGTNGSVLVDRDGYEVYDLGGHKTSEFRVKKREDVVCRFGWPRFDDRRRTSQTSLPASRRAKSCILRSKWATLQ